MYVKTGPKRSIGKHISEYFKTLTWREIVSRMEGKNPLVFIIVKKATGEVHNVIVKAGDNLEGLTDEDLATYRTRDLPAPELPIRKNIDAIFTTPKIVGIEKHDEPLPPKKEELPSTTLNHVVEIDDEDLPPLEKQEELVPVEKDTLTLLPAEETPEEGEVDLQVGMDIVFEDGGGELSGKISLLLESEGQLLVQPFGSQKKQIIDVTQIKRLA